MVKDHKINYKFLILVHDFLGSDVWYWRSLTTFRRN